MSNSINPLILRNITSNSTVTPLNLRAGQLLHAQYVNKDSNGLSTLKVGNTLLQTTLTQTLNAGEKILLEVVKTGTQPVMRLYTRQTPEKLNPSIISAAIKQNIGNQNSAVLLLNTLLLVQKQSPLYSQLPLSIRRLMKKVIAQVTPAAKIITPAGVKKAFQNSGLLLESHLLGAQQSSAKVNTSALSQTLNLDFKASLLQLKQQLTLASNTKNTSQLNPTKTKPTSDSYPPLGRSSADKLSTTNIPITSNNTKFIPPIDLLKTPTSTSIRSANSGVSGTYNSILYRYALQSLRTSYEAFALKPLLRNSTPYPAGSPKSALTISADKLASTHQGLIIQLLKMVDSSLARINIAQLSSATVDSDNKQVWLFDIPLIKENHKEHELIQAKIDVDKEVDDDNNNRLWTVQLALDLSTLGPLQVKISLQGHKVQAHFKSSDPQQQQLIEQHINILRENLSQTGLLVEKLICTQGLVEHVDPDTSQPLIDEEA